MKIILCMPTGSGKTVTFADIAKSSVMNGAKVMVVVDRKELLDQAEEKLIEYGLMPSIIKAGRTMRSGGSCYVATVQTLMRRDFPEIDLLVIDEAHKQIFDKVLQLDIYKDVYTIGATATPKRSGKMTQLSELYDDMVEVVTIRDLITKGFLVPAITYGANVDTSNIKLKGRDFDNSALYKAFDKAVLYSGVVEKYKKFADGTKAICFNINVEHSKNVCEAFRSAGYEAVHLDGNTPTAERRHILSAFHKGFIDILCNVGVLTTGFDDYSIETVIVNLATLSLPKWLQMAGRGGRITPKEFKGKKGYVQKEHFNLIDMGGNVFKHGFWEQERRYNLTHERRDTLGVAPVRNCPEDLFDHPHPEDREPRMGCGAVLHASASTCKYCGFIFPKTLKKEVETEFIQLENYEFLPPELVGKRWGSMSIEELEEVRRVKGYKQGWIIRQILMNKDHELIDYARMKGYQYPEAWTERRLNQTRYKKLVDAREESRPEFYFYSHAESDCVWKQRTKITDESTMMEVDEIDEPEYHEMLKAFGEEDGSEKIFDL